MTIRTFLASVILALTLALPVAAQEGTPSPLADRIDARAAEIDGQVITWRRD
ncbi:MAG: hypothetical protein IH820_00625, partial [Bacteroidetes bacterium]|nr:hypothetical protein [Bacteroidota bacterium]